MKVPRVKSLQKPPTLVLLAPPEEAVVHFVEPPLTPERGNRPCEGEDCPWCHARVRRHEQCYAGVLYQPGYFRMAGWELMPAWCCGITGVNARLAAELLEHGRGVVFQQWLPDGACEARWELLPPRPDLAGDHQVDVRAEMDRLWGRLPEPPAALYRPEQGGEDLAPPTDQVS